MAGMRERKLVPELLDHLPHDDPSAVRSRADLRRINFLMGNERDALRMAAGFPQAATRGITEWGAGEGSLVVRLARRFPGSRIVACDLAPRPGFPEDVNGRIEWRSGDLLAAPAGEGGLLIANLFLHHFEGETLRELGRRCEGYEALVFIEPDRARLPLMHAGLLWPFVNPVTRHDMRVSILAGFRQGEIQAQMGLDPGVWTFRETSTWRGARRVVGWRA